MPIASMIRDLLVSDELKAQIDKIKANTGTMGYDPWGLNLDDAALGLAALKPVYDNYFRVTTHDIENVPGHGRALLIGNHAGNWPLDGVMISLSIALRDQDPRICRAMVERFFPTVPYLGKAMNRAGAVVGDPQNCIRMLENEEAVIVFPEGVGGSGKTWDKRYQLQRFGNGFLHMAMQTNTPIIPVGVIGFEETMPSLKNLAPQLAWTGVAPPIVSVGPQFPLPAKVSIYYGEPLQFENDAKSEAEVSHRVEQVKDSIRALLERGLSERQGIYV